MATTIWLDRPSHDRLVALKAHFGVSSIGAVIRALLEQPADTAQEIYHRRKRQVDAACRKHGVERLVAFGSRARGDARIDSDLDVSIRLSPDGDAFAFFRAKEALEQAFACPLDVIGYPTHRPRVIANIERDGVVLYARR